MKIDILTLFPEMFAPLKESIIGRAVKNNILEINIHNIRDYSTQNHKKCDDYSFGGGAGMLMMPQPIASCINAIDKDHNAHRIYMSPKGKTFNQNMIGGFIDKQHLLILCGHYEGVDERIIQLYIDEELSIGDYVLTGGELPAMVVCDSVSRYVEGVLKEGSLQSETFTDNCLEYPQYTRPQVFEGLAVPDVLVSGNHQNILKWREEQSAKITKEKRPDLLNGK